MLRGATVGRRVLAAGGWALALAMVAACGLRLFRADSSTFEIAVVSALPWVLLPALPLLALAVWRRRWVMAGVAALVLLAGGLWEGPVLWPLPRAGAAAATGRIMLYDANLAQDNFHPLEVASEIRAERPAVITLEELTPPALATLERSGALDGYRWSLALPQYGAGGMGLWSDLPASGLSSWTLPPAQREIEAWVHPPGGRPVRVDAVHVYAPVGRAQPGLWRWQLGVVRAHLAGEPRPLIVAGDFNATADDQPFRAILGLHLADAAVLAGQGWRMTWPRDQRWVIPYLRIDHILLSPGLTVTGYRLGVGGGSDHHPVIVGVAPRAG